MVTFSSGCKDNIELNAGSAQTIELLMTKKEWDAWYPPAPSLYLLKYFCYSIFLTVCTWLRSKTVKIHRGISGSSSEYSTSCCPPHSSLPLSYNVVSVTFTSLHCILISTLNYTTVSLVHFLKTLRSSQCTKYHILLMCFVKSVDSAILSLWK